MTDQLTLPPRDAATTTQDQGDHLFGGKTPDGERHFFERRPDGRLPGPSLCGRDRWSAAVRRELGGRFCGGCVAELRDQLRATVVALSHAGIRIDTAVVPQDDQAGDHYAGMDR